MPSSRHRRTLARLRARTRDLLRPLDRLGRTRPAASGPAVRGPIMAGLAIIGVFFGAIVGWAGTAPLESAAIAPGLVGFSGFRKTVQHLEGGIVREILVGDGDRVEAGQPLLRLDDTRARAALAALEAQMAATTALEARLRTEQAGASTVSFPTWLLARAGEPAVAEAVQAQRELFAARRDALRQQLDIVAQRIGQNEEQVRGLEGEVAAQGRELAIVRREIATLGPLAQRGILPRNRLTTLERDQAQLEGGLSQNAATIAAAQLAIGELRLKLAEIEAQRAGEVAEAVRLAQDRRRALESELAAAQDMLARTTIVAPIAGYVVNRRIHTTGGVIAPGAPLLDLVPDHAGKLAIEARIDPKDRDVVTAGQEAWVRFNAFSQRLTDRVQGMVVSISADRLAAEDPAAPPYYRAIVELHGDPRAALGGAEIHPGMQAEVLIVTGRRSALAYLLRPVLFSIQRGLRES